MEKYILQGKIGEGTFSQVWKCVVKEAGHPMDGKAASVKRMKKKYPSVDHVNSLREVQALKRLNPHPNILQLIEVVYTEEAQSLDLVCELLTINLYERIKDRKQPLATSLVKSYMYQLCKALEHMHRNGIFHRDVKPENILLDLEDNLKLADFGSCRGIYSKVPFTEYISTRWYRAPECLLTDGYYGFKMDTWSVGCVFFEVATLRPLFPGTNELDQLDKIHGILGVPDRIVMNKIRKNSMHMSFKFRDTPGCGLAKCLPHGSAHFLDVLAGLLEYDPDERMSARQALRHPYFAEQRKMDRSRNVGRHAGGDTADVSPSPPPPVQERLAPTRKQATISASTLPHVRTKTTVTVPAKANLRGTGGNAQQRAAAAPASNAAHHGKGARSNGPRAAVAPKRKPRLHHPMLSGPSGPGENKWSGAAPRTKAKATAQPPVYSHSYNVRSAVRKPARQPNQVGPVLPPLVLKQVKPQANPAKFYKKNKAVGRR
mmetsp:Transcript_35242/g.92201  ORF Transcript_35242/g.92201 Transcript_35242/m.92201 type:complete len:487 (+) Transcript_35242:303-1763(+)|eukprot:CAMPEP_0182929822 /NCGR_PEP_ID=MMETSP0105_2-20130417/22765_1 /TAXON_ID=81532 ORGANISM="Acanthoeca-like sp., Strain 10tr" /NCGR_SAMPLE_ID=MMETSP0105_2 /ASSEMBLY_ACC=CAM_ASM_000205 /LENGTH=486 /DNA_ID=CAMNT_0025068015 /DNA_START=224 /DNA_END=1684 /DNA_ORIENTATION=-